MKKHKNIVAYILCTITLLSINLNAKAETLANDNPEEVYISTILQQLQDNGEIDMRDVVAADVVVGINTNSDILGVETLNNDIEKVEAVKITIENEYEKTDVYAVPFYEENGELYNVSRASTKNLPFEDTQYVYVLVTAVYQYYSNSDTGYNGVYYRPSLVKAKWSDSTGSKSVKSLYAHFNNASYVYNMSTYQKYYSNIVNRMSYVDISNPSNGITYVGNVINLPTNTAYSTFFNGIDAYAYVSGYVTDNSSKKYEFSFQVFDGSGLYPGM